MAGARAPPGTLTKLLQALLGGLLRHRPHSTAGLLAPAYRDALTLLSALDPLPRDALSLVFDSVTEPITITQLAALLLSCSAFLRRFDATVTRSPPPPPVGVAPVPVAPAVPLHLPEAEKLYRIVQWRFDAKELFELESAKQSDITAVYTCTFHTLVDRFAATSGGVTLELPLLPLGQTCIQNEVPSNHDCCYD